MFYRLHITTEPIHNEDCYYSFNIEKIFFNDKTYILDGVDQRKFIYENNIDRIKIRIQESSESHRAYANFARLNNVFKLIDLDFLNKYSLFGKMSKCINAELPSNCPIKYKLVIFREFDILNRKESNIELINNTFVTPGKTYFNNLISKIVLDKSKIKNINGVIRIKHLGETLVCTQRVKDLIIKNNLTGVEFEELSIK